MSKSLKVLIVEDCEDDVLLLTLRLRQGGQQVHTRWVDSAAALSQALTDEEWDVVLSDYSLPSFTAIDALFMLQKKGLDLPFIIVSGAIGEETAVAAMKAGAHDYVMKDNLVRLLPAIEREMREAAIRRERRQAEEALKESERENREMSREFRALLDNIPDSLTLLDSNMQVIWGNLSTAKLLNRNPEGLEGLHCNELWPDCTARGGECPVRRSFASCQVEKGVVRTEDERTWGVRAFPVSNRHGQVVSVIKMASDISRQIQLREEASRTGQLASLGELAAGVAHEINNPINGIINYAQILADQLAKDDDGREIVREIIDEGERVANIVKNLLDFAKARPEVKQPVAVEDILAAALALTKSQLNRDGIRLLVDMTPDLPPVLAHLQQVQQVVLNVISNARYALNQKYPGADEKKVFHIETETCFVQGQLCARLSFLDRGVGIAPGILPKVMDPFYSTKPSGAGTGLGLSISHGIIKDHGGEIRIFSEQDRYTRVVIDLPVADASSQDQFQKGAGGSR
ncbi:MAG: histidine kinase dimerization/phospho-acceptor domain-containing protein [Syntrophotaleaceae bacterium]